MRYAVQNLTWTDCVTLPAGLQGELNNDKYCTMLFNDEVHTYEQVSLFFLALYEERI